MHAGTGTAILCFLTGVLAGALGYRALSPEPELAPPPPALARKKEKVVCAQLSSAAPDAEEGEETELKLRWCEARLAEKSREKPTARQDWPAGIPEDEAPESWGAAIDSTLSGCGASSPPEVTDCEEYPCVGLVKLPSNTDAYVEADRINNCLNEHLPGALSEISGAVVVRARCPDGREEPVLLVSAASREGTSLTLPAEETASFTSLLYLGMLTGRRAESALQLWQCEDP